MSYSSMFGFIKALGAWQASYLFHMGASDIYFSMKNRTKANWFSVSRIGCLIIGFISCGFVLVGFLAASGEPSRNLTKGPKEQIPDLCASSDMYLVLYLRDGWVRFCNMLLTVTLGLTYPLFFYFLREYVLGIAKKIISVEKMVSFIRIFFYLVFARMIKPYGHFL